MPPKKPAPWTGGGECFAFTSVCPQTQADIRGEYAQLIMWDRQVADGRGLPVAQRSGPPPPTDRQEAVLVSFHGGGFATGSANAPGFDGKNLAYYGDVVGVGVNPPLASFGYTDLVGRRAPEAFNIGRRRVMDWSPRCSG